MCQFTYHHIPLCGHIGEYTMNACGEYTNALRQGNGHHRCSTVHTEHDLLPVDHRESCVECVDQLTDGAANTFPVADPGSRPCSPLEEIDGQGPIVQAHMNPLPDPRVISEINSANLDDVLTDRAATPSTTGSVSDEDEVSCDESLCKSVSDLGLFDMFVEDSNEDEDVSFGEPLCKSVSDLGLFDLFMEDPNVDEDMGVVEILCESVSDLGLFDLFVEDHSEEEYFGCVESLYESACEYDTDRFDIIVEGSDDSDQEEETHPPLSPSSVYSREAWSERIIHAPSPVSPLSERTSQSHTEYHPYRTGANWNFFFQRDSDDERYDADEENESSDYMSSGQYLPPRAAYLNDSDDETFSNIGCKTWAPEPEYLSSFGDRSSLQSPVPGDFESAASLSIDEVGECEEMEIGIAVTEARMSVLAAQLGDLEEALFESRATAAASKPNQSPVQWLGNRLFSAAKSALKFFQGSDSGYDGDDERSEGDLGSTFLDVGESDVGDWDGFDDSSDIEEELRLTEAKLNDLQLQVDDMHNQYVRKTLSTLLDRLGVTHDVLLQRTSSLSKGRR